MQNNTYRSKRGNEEGVSMVEMAIVLLIFGIVIAFALPVVVNSIRSYNLRSAAERIAERLAGARALAMAKNKNVTASFPTAARELYAVWLFLLPANRQTELRTPVIRMTLLKVIS